MIITFTSIILIYGQTINEKKHASISPPARIINHQFQKKQIIQITNEHKTEPAIKAQHQVKSRSPNQKLNPHQKAQKKYRHIDPKTGLRTAYYRAALPKSVPGGKRINLSEAHTHFLNKSALFLDVMAHTGAGPNPLDGNWQLSAKRSNIPGSTWLADVGTGTLSKKMHTYYKSNLKKLTDNQKEKTIIIYCTADCWMAWNAVQRAAHWGYSNILWFPEGTDDWQDAGYPLENATPIPLSIKE